MSRTYSSPGFENTIDRPMRLAEIYVAAEHALKQTISSSDLWKCLSAVEEFEVKNMQQYLQKTTWLELMHIMHYALQKFWPLSSLFSIFVCWTKLRNMGTIDWMMRSCSNCGSWLHFQFFCICLIHLDIAEHIRCVKKLYIGQWLDIWIIMLNASFVCLFSFEKWRK